MEMITAHETTRPAAAISARHRALILTALTLGGFAIGTSEFSAMGLMPEMVKSFGVTEPQVGHIISAYALGVVVGAPLLAILGGRLPRRALLLALMGFYALGNLASALAPTYASMMLARFVAGLPHGAYFGVAALTAVAISKPAERGKAVSLTMFGLTVAILIGNPIATWMGQTIGWRWAFVMVSATAVATVVLIAAFMPRDAAEAPKRALDELRAFNRLPVWQALAIGAVGFSGLFCVFSYLAPTMLQVTQAPASLIPLGLAGLGLGGVFGNFFRRLAVRSTTLSRGAGDSDRRGGDAAAVSVGNRLPVDTTAGHCCDRHDGCARPGAADAFDGRGGRRTDLGGRIASCGVQCRERIGPLARRYGDHGRLGLDFDRLCRRHDSAARHDDLCVGCGNAAAVARSLRRMLKRASVQK